MIPSRAVSDVTKWPASGRVELVGKGQSRRLRRLRRLRSLRRRAPESVHRKQCQAMRIQQGRRARGVVKGEKIECRAQCAVGRAVL
jgi:hypothetical protein